MDTKLSALLFNLASVLASDAKINFQRFHCYQQAPLSWSLTAVNLHTITKAKK